MGVVRIHQVRSYGNNIAVNVWWRHCLNDNLNTRSVDNTCRPLDIDVMGCSHHHHDDRDDVIDLSLTLDKVTVRGNRLDGKENVQSLRLCLLSLLGGIAIVVQAIPPIATHFSVPWFVCLSDVCRICTPCLCRSADVDDWSATKILLVVTWNILGLLALPYLTYRADATKAASSTQATRWAHGASP